MKYRLLKDKITDIGYFGWCKDKQSVVECSGFHSFEIRRQVEPVLDGLPDIVEELTPTPTGLIQFDDWDQEVFPILKDDFFFHIDTIVRKWPDGNGKLTWQTRDCDTIIHISRNWLEPIPE